MVLRERVFVTIKPLVMEVRFESSRKETAGMHAEELRSHFWVEQLMVNGQLKPFAGNAFARVVITANKYITDCRKINNRSIRNHRPGRDPFFGFRMAKREGKKLFPQRKRARCGMFFFFGVFRVLPVLASRS